MTRTLLLGVVPSRPNTLVETNQQRVTILQAAIPDCIATRPLPKLYDTMSDSEDYGDGYDDTEFFNAATQAEKENSPA